MNFNRPTHDFGNGKIITFRSGWECNFAFYLEWMKKKKEIKDWIYEPERYQYLGGSYLPDFKIIRNDETWYLAEVKGYKQGVRKLSRMKKYYPEIKIELWDAEAYKELKKKMGKILNFI